VATAGEAGAGQNWPGHGGDSVGGSIAMGVAQVRESGSVWYDRTISVSLTILTDRWVPFEGFLCELF
jgi:hypothetical protein